MPFAATPKGNLRIARDGEVPFIHIGVDAASARHAVRAVEPVDGAPAIAGGPGMSASAAQPMREKRPQAASPSNLRSANQRSGRRVCASCSGVGGRPCSESSAGDKNMDRRDGLGLPSARRSRKRRFAIASHRRRPTVRTSKDTGLQDSARSARRASSDSPGASSRKHCSRCDAATRRGRVLPCV